MLSSRLRFHRLPFRSPMSFLFPEPFDTDISGGDIFLMYILTTSEKTFPVGLKWLFPRDTCPLWQGSIPPYMSLVEVDDQIEGYKI